MADVAHPGLGGDLPERVAIRPSWAAGNHERWDVHSGSKLAVGGQQPGVVLAGFNRADGKDVTRFEAGRQQAGRRQRRHAEWYDRDFSLQPGDRIAAQEIVSGRLRDDEDGSRLAQRRSHDRAHVGALLPRNLGGTQPVREVVDAHDSRRRADTPSGRARPVGIEDGVAFELRFDGRKPQRFQCQLVPVARQDGFAIQPLEGRRALAAAEEGELIRAAAGDQRPGQLHRDSGHAYAPRPPAGCYVNCEPGHRSTVPGKREGPPPFGGGPSERREGD